MSARVHGGVLEVAVCTELELTGIDAQSRDLPDDWSTFWDVEGNAVVNSGDILTSSSLPLPGDVAEPELTDSTELSISLETEGGNRIAAFYALDEEWRDSSGDVRQEPCG